MKQLFLHIGLGKTGSSAIQSWLSLNAETLSRQGIDYADLIPAAKHGEVSSGNGYILHRAVVSQDFDEVERLITSTYFYNSKNSVSIISCELLQGIKAVYIKRIREICEKNDIHVSVIAYVRSVYEQSYSTYIQGVKRSSVTHCFGEKSDDICFFTTVEYLKRYLDVFGDDLIVLNYDGAKKDIYASFATTTGIDRSETMEIKVKVNRSLTLQEAEVLRGVNALHKGIFSSKISDFVIGLSPDVKTTVLYDEVLVHRVRKDTEEDMRWINQQFGMTSPLVSDYYSGQKNINSVHPNRASYQPVLRWALQYEPCESLQIDFELFLKDFSVFLVKISSKDSLALISRAHDIQQEIAARKDALVDDSGVEQLIGGAKGKDDAISDPVIPKPERAKPRYIITYHHDKNLPNTFSREQFSSRFSEWLASLVGQNVGSTFNPIENTHVLNSPDSLLAGDKASMSGFTIIEAEDMDAVLSIVKKCPLLEVGGSVEASNIVQLY
jgi:hypothetical protein